MRIVLLGDLHFYRLGVWPWQLLGKRLWGQMNLWLNRRKAFRLDRWDRIVERVEGIGPERVLFSGDLVTTALPGEFAMARRAVGKLLSGYPAVIVPGNHDRHSFASARKKMLEAAFPDHVPRIFPHHLDLGCGLHLIALDPTRANIISDKGCLGGQVGALGSILGGLPGGSRVMVLCHYTLGTPPGLHREARRHRMIDERALGAALGAAGHDTLYLHGHVHKPFVWRLPEAPNVVAVDAGAPMMHDARWPGGQGFWEIDAAAGWRLTHHAMDAAGRWSAEIVTVPGGAGQAVTFPAA